jgi:hypothetical protein
VSFSEDKTTPLTLIKTLFQCQFAGTIISTNLLGLMMQQTRHD